MIKSELYTTDFFESIRVRSKLSAAAMVPVVLEFIRPGRVVDIGCGTGEFLRVFQEYGVKEILGIDGEYIGSSYLAIPQANFKALDLTKPFRLDKPYDLALCLEVAEHLAPESALDFIDSLTRSAPIILFSAAIPHQGGTHHINEQWPEYWAQLFRARGFLTVDAIRKKIWSNNDIAAWYRQNAMFFCTEEVLANNEALEREFKVTNQNMLSIVHPEIYLLGHNAPHMSVLNPIGRVARKLYHLLQK